MLLPLISIIIPTYNYSKYIGEALNSVLEQSYPMDKIEIIVLDDGSTDNTKEVLQSHINRGTIQYFFQNNKGKANATRVAIQKCTGKYIFNLDADDFFLNEKVAKTVEVFESNPEIVHVATPAKIVYDEFPFKKAENEKIPVEFFGRQLDGKWLLECFYTRNILYGGGTTYAARASILKTIDIPDSVDMYIDEFLLLAVLPFGKTFFLEQPLSAWRVHSSNYSGNHISKEKQVSKRQRLIRSSEGVLAYLEQNSYNAQILKIYRLRNATRRLAHKEFLDNKKMEDIYQYAYEVFLQIQPGWQLIKNYNVINRLIPSHLFNFLKNRIAKILHSLIYLVQLFKI